MAIFDVSSPANADAVKLGAAQIRDLKTALNTMLGTLFEDDGSTPKSSTVTTDEIVNLAVTTGKIAALAITAAKIAAGAVETAKLADDVLHSDTYQTVGPLVVSQVYRIRSRLGSDDFTNVGAASNDVGTIFTASGTTPTLWVSASSLSTPDAVGLAKMQDKFVKTAKLEDLAVTEGKIAADAVTEDKILDGAVTPEKLSADVGNAHALARWTGAGYEQFIVSKTLPGSNRLLVSAFTGLPIAGAGVTLQNAPCGIVVNGVTDSGFLDTVGNFEWGMMYYLYAPDNTHVSLHTSPQGAIDGTTGIVVMGTPGPLVGAGTYYLKFLDWSTVYKRGCDVVPVVSTNSVNRVHGFRIIWRTAWDDALSGVVQVEQQYDTASGSNASQSLQPTVVTADDTVVCYITSAGDWRTSSSDYAVSDIQGFTGSNMVVAFQ